MGTFHQHKNELHGITVVVEAIGEDGGAETYVARCDDIRGGRIILLDGDVHREGQPGPSKEEFLKKAARFGVWKKFDHVLLDTARVASIRRLGDL
jgi:hypothetical protein